MDSIDKKLQAAEEGRELPRLNRAKVVRLSCAEISQLCDAQPDHPIAKVYRKAIRGKDETRMVMVDRADVQALRHGGRSKLTEVVRQDIDGNDYTELTKVHVPANEVIDDEGDDE